MNTIVRIFCLSIFGLLLTACFPGGGQVTVVPPTSAPSTATAVIVTATAPAQPATATAPLATDTAVPTQPAVPTSTPPPAASATAVITDPRPAEAIDILQPGPGSRLTSPLIVSGQADPTFEQSLAITILSADGVQLANSYTQIGADMGQRGPFTAEVTFSVSEEQQAFIQVYAISAKDGGVTHLSSVGVTLAPGGAVSILPAQAGPEQIHILQPANGATISGGLLQVEGFGLASFEQTLVIELLDEDGITMVTVPVTVAAPDLGQPGFFRADIPYTLASAATSARLVVRDISPAHGDNSHLTSVEITLQP